MSEWPTSSIIDTWWFFFWKLTKYITYTYSSKEHNPDQIFVTAYDLVFQHTNGTLDEVR